MTKWLHIAVLVLQAVVELFGALRRRQDRDAGAREALDKVNADADAAQRRADAEIVRPRDPDDTVNRLRRHEF